LGRAGGALKNSLADITSQIMLCLEIKTIGQYRLTNILQIPARFLMIWEY
jgi:hypothetical protein